MHVEGVCARVEALGRCPNCSRQLGLARTVMVPAAPWLGLGAWGQWPLGVASYTGGEHRPVWLPCSLWAVRGREPKPAASKAWRHGRHYSPQHSYGPGVCSVSTSALFARFYSPPLVCCSHVHTTSMVRWSDPDRYKLRPAR